MKFSSDHYFLGNFRLCNRINSVQTIFRKDNGCLQRQEKKYNPRKITVNVLEDN